MCGIFSYLGKKKGLQEVLKGLKKLEYRGYDSSGVCGIKDQKIVLFKQVGKISSLEAKIKDKELELDIVLGHTRWATHGKPTEENAHPHIDEKKTIAIVHNGIIENYDYLKKILEKQGKKFYSDTDTEVLIKFIASLYEGDLLKALKKALKQIKGSFAIVLAHVDYPDQVFAVAKDSPLAIGVGEEEHFIASDANAFLEKASKAIYLYDGEIAVVKKDDYKIYDPQFNVIEKRHIDLLHSLEEASKGNYEHYTLKEIHEQPQAIRKTLLSRFVSSYGNAHLSGINMEDHELQSFERILILACGSSYHAGKIAAYMLEEKARIPTQVEISSEYRYKNPIISFNTLVIAISQSGETADTIAAVRELKAKGAKVIGICNVSGSTLAREADGCLFLRVGPEIGVCSTKAFTSQVVVLSLFALLMGRLRHLTTEEGKSILHALNDLPDQISMILDQEERIQEIAKKYSSYENFFFLGRHYMYPTALEGALKLKEISYINANGYPAGEMKHGPIALIHENCPTIALCANDKTEEKMRSNLMEVKARDGKVIAIVKESQKDNFLEIADELITVPDSIDELSPVLASVVTQLFAYYVAKDRGAEIDQPRNLAKSVTVE